MTTNLHIIIVCATIFIFTAGCMSTQKHYQQTHGYQDHEMTVGTVQKEITEGMSGAEVAAVLGSPNIVTTDEERREVWVYDKVSTDVTYSHSSGGAGMALIIGAVTGNALIGGVPSGRYSKATGAESKTQKTLTVIIKFDKENKVRDFAYHSSKF